MAGENLTALRYGPWRVTYVGQPIDPKLAERLAEAEAHVAREATAAPDMLDWQRWRCGFTEYRRLVREDVRP